MRPGFIRPHLHVRDFALGRRASLAPSSAWLQSRIYHRVVLSPHIRRQVTDLLSRLPLRGIPRLASLPSAGCAAKLACVFGGRL